MRRKDLCHIPIEDCLKDAGCSKETIAQVLQCVESQDEKRKWLLLKQQRCHLMERMHSCQEQIDCLDSLLYQIKKEKNNSDKSDKSKKQMDDKNEEDKK